MNAPLSREALQQDKLKALLDALTKKVVVNGAGAVVLAARNMYTDPAIFELEVEDMIEGDGI